MFLAPLDSIQSNKTIERNLTSFAGEVIVTSSTPEQETGYSSKISCFEEGGKNLFFGSLHGNFLFTYLSFVLYENGSSDKGYGIFVVSSMSISQDSISHSKT